MKKNFFIFSVVVGELLFMSSCQKVRYENDALNQEDITIKKIKALAYAYNNKINNNPENVVLKENAGEEDKPCFWVVVKADVGGALEGGANGSVIGSAIPGVGSVTGAAIGAVVEGAAASASAYLLCKGNENSNNNNSNSKIGHPFAGVKENTNNPFEVVGKLHNLGMKVMIDSSYKYFINNNLDWITYKQWLKIIVPEYYKNLSLYRDIREFC